MTFEIEGIAEPRKAVDYAADWMRDLCANWRPDYTDAQVVQAYAHHLIGDMKRPKKFETVIGQMTFNWSFLRCLADENPGLFTEVWVAFTERFYGGE
jgi:hypothetical protein